MDWTDTGYSYHIDVHVVSPVNVDDTLGSLSGVLLTGTSITENYNSDSRVQAKVTTVVKEGESDGYVEHARLRIVASIPDRNWSEELVTGYVSDVDETIENGACQRVYSVEGTIWGLLNHEIESPIVIAKGSSLKFVWARLISRLTLMQYTVAGAKDHAFTNNIVYEAGTALSTILFEISSGYNRMDNDGHGRLRLLAYTRPSQATATDVLDIHDGRGLSMYPLTRQESKSEAPGRAIVTSTKSVEVNGKSQQKVLVGYYDAPETHETSKAARGYLKATHSSYSGVSDDPTISELTKAAKENWTKAQEGLGAEWTCRSVFKDYHIGMVLDLVHPSSNSSYGFKTSKVLLTGVSTNLQEWTQDLTMKEV